MHKLKSISKENVESRPFEISVNITNKEKLNIPLDEKSDSNESKLQISHSIEKPNLNIEEVKINKNLISQEQLNTSDIQSQLIDNDKPQIVKDIWQIEQDLFEFINNTY